MACNSRIDYKLRDTLQAFATVAGIISLDTTLGCGKLSWDVTAKGKSQEL
jgi:hypothetical protein